MHKIRSKVASLLVLVIGVEVAETDTSFLIRLFWAQSNSSSSTLSCYS